jgi:hypothetical protein
MTRIMGSNHLRVSQNACRSADTAEETVCDWIRRGEDCHSSRRGSNQFAEFAAVIGKAEAVREPVLGLAIDSVAIGCQVTVTKTKQRQASSRYPVLAVRDATHVPDTMGTVYGPLDTSSALSRPR